MFNNIRFNVKTLIETHNLDVSQLEKLEKTRKHEGYYEGSIPYKHQFNDQRQTDAYRKVFSTILDRSIQMWMGFDILKGAKRDLVNSLDGWIIDGCVIAYAVSTSLSHSLSDREKTFHCYWNPQNTYTLLLDWGWNEEFFLDPNNNVWGHEKCSYKIEKLTRDELIILKELIEKNILSDNYRECFFQINEILETGTFTEYFD